MSQNQPQNYDHLIEKLETDLEIVNRRLEKTDPARPWFRRDAALKVSVERELAHLRALSAGHMANGQDAPTEQGFTHSQDYRSVNLRGKTYSLTSGQAHVIQILHDAYKNGTPEVGSDYILEALGTPNSRLRDTFKTNPSAWKALIVRGNRKGARRLNL